MQPSVPRSVTSEAPPTNKAAPAPVGRVPLLDIGRENTPLESEILAAITEVAKSGRFVMGPECQQLESEIAKLCRVKHAIGCASGSDALLLSLMAIDLQPGDEVIVPSFTFFATASAVWRLGGVPIFVDIDPRTFNLDPELVKSAITAKTKAIIPVHLFGQPAEMATINTVAQDHDIIVIEDAAQAIGAEYQGRPTGSLGDMGCFSFYPTKNLGGFGDGGVLTTNSDSLADKLRLLRGHGMQPRYYHEVVGVNSRLDTLQAAVLKVKLPNLEVWTASRRENAHRYGQLFREAGIGEHVCLPTDSSDVKHVWNQYTIRVGSGQREQLREFLQQNGIGTEVYYPVPLHQQNCFQSLKAHQRPLPETERAAREVLSLPIFPTMTQDEQRTVVTRIAEFFETHQPASASALPHLHVQDASTRPLQSL